MTVLLAFLVAAPSSAQAGTFRQILCFDPDTGTAVGAPPLARQVASRFDIAVRADCAGQLSPDKGIVVSPDARENRRGAGDLSVIAFDLPPDVSLLATEWFRTYLGGGNDSGWAFGWYVGKRLPEGFDSQDGTQVSAGNPDRPLSGENFRSFSDGERPPSHGFEAKCFGAPLPNGERKGECEPADMQYRIYAGKLTLEDLRPPTVTSLTAGSVTQDAELKGFETIKARVDDAGAGVYRLVVRVDGRVHETRVLDDNGGTCRDVVPSTPYGYEFVVPAPCKPRVDFEAQLDTRTLPDGVHNLVIGVEDGSGNEVALTQRRVEIDNVPTLNGAGFGSGIRIGLSRREVSLAYGRGTVLQGKLVTAAGRGVGGATLERSSRITGSGATRPLAPVKTDARGRFRLRVSPGPSRMVALGFRPDLDEPLQTARRQVAVRVRAKLTLSSSRRAVVNGQIVRFSGRLLGSGIGGKLVDVEGRAASGWRTACRARTRANGRFACQYQFRSTRGVVRYRLRARIRRQTGLQYEPAASRSRQVTVRGLP